MRNEQKNQSYLAVNPTGSIPMVTDGGYKVLGGSQVLLNYICSSQKNIKEMLYPAEMTNDIQKYFSLVPSFDEASLAETDQNACVPLSFSQPVTKEDIEKEKDEFFKRLLAALDQQLVNKQYLTGTDMSAADVLYYSEISTVCALTGRELSADVYTNLPSWYQRMSALPEIVELDKHLKDVIEKYNI
eukprot:CAMPEP_0170556502 /NCGR_PEP_ID=MMETSP0211-20121228/17124_1 /TAXON_ID=311385 /ORGANISM="Pseudokeronopsis sp., Strain OXSARD2" /LENGTH=186 /DNA_ID=CAMNT_0010866867 /DNA_START=151 /DNA_END=711 /DNA_ORIENTATION=-